MLALLPLSGTEMSFLGVLAHGLTFKKYEQLLRIFANIYSFILSLGDEICVDMVDIDSCL